MKRYLLFGGIAYYPQGGWRDLQGNFDTVAEAQAQLVANPLKPYDWYQIVDTTNTTLVQRYPST